MDVVNNVYEIRTLHIYTHNKIHSHLLAFRVHTSNNVKKMTQNSFRSSQSDTTGHPQISHHQGVSLNNTHRIAQRKKNEEKNGSNRAYISFCSRAASTSMLQTHQ